MKPAIRHVLILLLALALVFSISGALILSAILLVDWLARLFVAGEKSTWRRSALDIPIATFFVWGIVVSLLGHSVGIVEAISAQSSFFLFYLVAHGLDDEDVRTGLRWFLYGSVIAGALSLIQYFSHINFIPTMKLYLTPDGVHLPASILRYVSLRDGRAIGTRSHPLTYAETLLPGFLALVSVLLMRWSAHKINVRRDLSVLFGLVFILAGILLAQGRGVWLASLIGFLFLTEGFFRQRRFVVWGVLASILLLGFVFSPRMRGRLISSFSSTSGTISDQQSKETRFELWKQTLSGIQSHFVAGVGLKGVDLVTHAPVTGLPDHWGETHNIYLQTWLETGTIGFAFFLWILYLIFAMSRTMSAASKTILILILVSFLAAGLTESWTRDKEITLIFWALVGFFENRRLNNKDVCHDEKN